MAVAVALWSLAIKPGKKEIVLPQSDLRITNVALDHELADPSGRTSVKFTFTTPVQIDSDDDGDDVPMEPLSTTVLCSLTPGKIEQSMIDLILEQDEEFVFETVGKNTIYLTGNYVDQSPPDNVPFNYDSEDSDEDAYDLRDVSSDAEVDINELDGFDDDRFEEVVEDEPKSLKRPREDATETSATEGKLSKAEKKKLKKLKAENGEAVTTSSDTPKTASEPKKEKASEPKKEKAKPAGEAKEIAGGLTIQDVKTGTGPQAKKGNTVSMRYIGRLQGPGGKVFDKNTKGKPLSFRLGQGEVIKGWDEGIVGMQAGGERLLTIPPNMAYGKKKMEGIPPNSTLLFECKLIDIK